MPLRSPIDETYLPVELSSGEFEEIKRLAEKLFALDLKPGKESLVSARLSKRVRESGVRSVREYIKLLREDTSGERLAALIDDLTTNFTSFLREPQHFDFLRKRVLDEFPAPSTLRIWSAGCSTGEEPYSILLTLRDAEPEAPESRFHIFASDISRPALDRARAGVYAKDRFQQFPPGWIPRYLQAGRGQWEGHYRVKRSSVSAIRFERRNLRDPFTDLSPFEVIFCRNVMIYFNREFQQDLVRRFAAKLVPGGYFFIGHSEGLMGLSQGLEFVQPAIYRKPLAARKA
jgi:chemotaxis protein methyltransferase CheR